MPEKRKELKHGSIDIIVSPDPKSSRRYLDFGPGFYTTNNGKMAEEWARIKMEIKKTNTAYINFYEPPVFPPEFKIKRFDSMDTEWLDFIVANRNDKSFHHDYDIVIGPTADLNVMQIVTEYEQKICSKKETLEKLKTRQIGMQISFHTNRATNLLKFIRTVKITDVPPGTKKKNNNGIKR